MSRFTYRFVGLATALVLIGAGLLIIYSLSNETPEPGDSADHALSTQLSKPARATPETVVAKGQRSHSAPQPAAAAPVPVLPDSDLPLVDTFVELSARAAAGDGLAACRLAVDLGVCASISHYQDNQLSDEVTVEIIARSDGDAAMRDEMLRQRLAMQTAHERGRRLCAGISDAQIQSLPRYQWQAANAGHLQAARDFLLGGGRVLTSTQLIADPELTRLYQQHALPLFEQLLARGEPVGAWVWSLANSGASTPLGLMLPPSMRNSHISASLMQRIVQDSFGETGAGLAADDFPPLSAEEQALVDRYYQPYRNSDGVREWAARAGLRAPAVGMANEERRQRALQECESARWR